MTVEEALDFLQTVCIKVPFFCNAAELFFSAGRELHLASAVVNNTPIASWDICIKFSLSLCQFVFMINGSH